MVDLSNFETFDFNEGVPYVSATINGLTFNKSVVMKMDYPPYARLLIDAANKQMAVQACDSTTEKAVLFYKPKPNGVLSVRWNARDLINTIERVAQWNLKEASYRVNGLYVPEQQLMLFDLNDATRLL